MVHKKSISGPIIGTAVKLTPPLNTQLSGKHDSKFAPLSLPALDFSLTKGTMIPSPPETPPNEQESSQQAPALGGGPLSSHPTTPIMQTMTNGTMFPPMTPTNTAIDLKANRVLGRDANDPGFLSQVNKTTAPSTTSRTSSSLKRFFSFRSRRNSRVGSADCFGNGGAYEPSGLGMQNGEKGNKRMQGAEAGVEAYRPASSMARYGPPPGGEAGEPPLRKKRSSTWFGTAGRRKSDLIMIGRLDEGGVEAPPTIQEVDVDTEIGGEELFKDIR